jgi:histidinol-phosphate aminotransferase
VLNAILEAATKGNLYPYGQLDLRAKLGARDDLGADNVLIGAGSTEIIDVLIRTFVAPGEEVLLSVPTFSMYEARTRTVGGIPVLVPLTEDHEHDVSKLIRAVTERTKLVFVCTPNNPTGLPVDEQDLRRILRLGLPTVIDEAYYEFGSEASLARLLGEFPNAIVIRTFSKAYGLAGLRLGYALGHSAVVQLLARVKVPWSVPSITIAAAIAALEDAPEFEARLREQKRERAMLVERLCRMPGVSALESEGNFVLIDVSRSGLTANRIVDGMLEQGVLIRSLATHHLGKTWVRVTVGTPEQNLQFLSAFERIVRRGRELDRALTPTPSFVAVRGDAE